jgi:serine phosphatase RsbU (regulator of sigma subunit)
LIGVYPEVDLSDAAVDLAPGDALILYSDGLVDERRGSDPFGGAGLANAARGAAGAGASRIAADLDETFRAFLGGDPPDDDVAFLVIAREALAGSRDRS